MALSMPALEASLASVQASMPAVHQALATLDLSMPAIGDLSSLALLSSLSSLGTIADGFGVQTYAPGRERFDIPFLREPQQQEGAEAAWRAARDELNRGNFRRSAELFERYIERYANSANAQNAYYWQAFSLYRLNGTDDLEEAKALLERQRSRFPRAATRSDADQLLVRVRSELAQRGDSGDAEIVTRQATAAAQQQGCPRDDDDDIRSTALNALLQMDAANAMPVLKRIMANRQACAAPMRRRAVFLVSQQRTTEREDILLDAARNDPDREVREQAVFWLSQVNTDKALSAIEEILQNTTDRAVQEKAIFALSQHRSPRAAAALRAWAESNNRPADLRKNAIFWLGQQRDPQNGRFLRELYTKLPAGELKEQTIFALSQRRGENNEQWMMTIALDENEDMEMRKKALFWAGQSRGTAVTDFANLYDRSRNREIKEQVIFVLSQRREAAAVDKMLDIARKEQDRELRKKAIFWLSQSKDPRVAALLLEIIGN